MNNSRGASIEAPIKNLQHRDRSLQQLYGGHNLFVTQQRDSLRCVALYTEGWCSWCSDSILSTWIIGTGTPEGNGPVNPRSIEDCDASYEFRRSVIYSLKELMIRPSTSTGN
jgi:hypothetical protein